MHPHWKKFWSPLCTSQKAPLSRSAPSPLCPVVQSLSHVQLFVGCQTCQTSLTFAISQSLLKLMSIELVMLFNHLVLCHPLFSSCLQSFPESGSFLRSWFFTSRGQSIEASASVPPVNIQGWFPLGLTGLICLQYKEISIVLSNTTVQKHQALMLGNIEGRREGEDRAALSLLYVSAPTSIHDCWKNHIFDYTDLCRQSEVSDF